jgi:hypothetical protein
MFSNDVSLKKIGKTHTHTYIGRKVNSNENDNGNWLR